MKIWFLDVYCKWGPDHQQRLAIKHGRLGMPHFVGILWEILVVFILFDCHLKLGHGFSKQGKVDGKCTASSAKTPSFVAGYLRFAG
jgi:hypothetical protein